MDINTIEQIAVNAIEEIKGQNIVTIDTTASSPMFERIVIASGTSTTQVKAIARNVQDKLRTAKLRQVGLEGEDSGEWVLVDFGCIVIHVMLPPIREYYNLEEIWQLETDPKFQAQYQSHQAHSHVPDTI